jgi:hypothetical protein
MFGRSNVFGTISGFGVRVKDAREKDKNHLIETKFEVPLTHDLADEILPAMAADIFIRIGNEWVPKPEVDGIDFNLSPDLQILELREHPELDPIVRIDGVTIRRVTAYKGEGNAVFLGFTTTWTLASEAEPIAIIKRLKTGVYMTTTVQQPKLQEAPADEPVAEAQPALDMAAEGSPEQEGPDGVDLSIDGDEPTPAQAEAEGDNVGNVDGAAGEVPARNRRPRRSHLRAVGTATVQ